MKQESPLAIILKEVKENTPIEICLLTKAVPPTNQATALFELVHLAVIQGLTISIADNNYVIHHNELEQIIDGLKQQSGATNFEFLRAGEWQRFLVGDPTLPQSTTLPQIKFQPVPITMINFQDGLFSTKEVNLPNQPKLTASLVD